MFMSPAVRYVPPSEATSSPVAAEEPAARLAGRQLARHREHRLAAAARIARARELLRHRGREPQHVAESVGRRRVDAHPRSADGRAEHGGVDADEHPRAALGVVADDDVLAVPARQQFVEVHRRGRYTPPPTWLANAPNSSSRSAKSSARPSRAACARPATCLASSTAAASRSRSPSHERELRRALTGAAGLHSILDVEIDGKGTTHASILKEYQVDPVRGGVTHVDLQEVRLDKPINASVSIHLIGGDVAPGVKEGGALSQVLREVTVEALPLEVPEHIELDVSAMEIGDAIRVAELAAPDGVTILDDPEAGRRHASRRRCAKSR